MPSKLFLENFFFVAKKLTELIKQQIMKGFRDGKSLSALAKEFGCTPATVTRTVKSFISDKEYTELKNKKSKKSSLKSIKPDLKNHSSIYSPFYLF